MMSNSFCFGLFLNAVLLLSILYLYFIDPYAFNTRLLLRILRIKFFFRTHFGKSAKEYKQKYYSLSNTIKFCEYTVCRYVNKKNLSTLSDDETLEELLKHYNELLYIDTLPEEEVDIENIRKLRDEIENLYFPDMDPYYQQDLEELA